MSVVIPPNLLWLPDVCLINSANHFYDESFKREFWALVNFDGYVVWQPAGLFQTDCDVSAVLFPYDTQVF